MKNLAVALLVTVAGIANAIEIPGYERPILGATLTHVDGPAYPRAMRLTLNKADGAEDFTTFTLVEDTGIRCITAPCPSRETTEFKIVDIDEEGGRFGTVTYTAYQIYKNVPPNARIARRKLVVEQSTMEIVAPGGQGFMSRTMWEVRLNHFSREVSRYSGEAEPLASILSDLN